LDIFQCINKGRSNVHCKCTRCKHNYDGICIHELRINQYKDSAYVLLEDCDIAYDDESQYDNMYWY
jgi:hypothetical protein